MKSEKFGGTVMFEFEPEFKKSETVAARNLGEKIAKMYGNIPPVPVKEIITSKYQIVVIELEIDPSVSAIVDLDMKEILINSTQGQQRGRFTLAHELGHIVLNHGIRKWKEYASYVGGNSDKPIEEEANAFAAGMLIPGFMLKSAVQRTKDPRELAKLFDVSEHSIWISLQTHKLIDKL